MLLSLEITRPAANVRCSAVSSSQQHATSHWYLLFIARFFAAKSSLRNASHPKEIFLETPQDSSPLAGLCKAQRPCQVRSQGQLVHCLAAVHQPCSSLVVDQQLA